MDLLSIEPQICLRPYFLNGEQDNCEDKNAANNSDSTDTIGTSGYPLRPISNRNERSGYNDGKDHHLWGMGALSIDGPLG
jgi:hypothetical protein